MSVDKLFNEVVSLFKNDFLTFEIDCRITINPTDLVLECDINLLKQVLINLVKNAVEALASEGSGIGLSFSKHIIRLHEGTISIWSQKGKGTTVKIKI